MRDPVPWCPECGYVFDVKFSILSCDRKRWNQEEQRFFYCPGKPIDLVAVYEEVKDRCFAPDCGCDRKHHTVADDGGPVCWLCVDRHEFRTLKALGAEKNEV